MSPFQMQLNWLLSMTYSKFSSAFLLTLSLALMIENTASFFSQRSFFRYKVTEMELGFMYDVLQTKATVIHSSHGCILRIFSLPFTSIMLLVFSVLVIDNQKYSTIDLVLTFLLLTVAILLEVYSLLLLLSSNQTGLWLTKHTTTCIGQAITFIQRAKQPRWSNSMSQFNLLSFSLKDKQTFCYGIQKLLHIAKMLEKNWYTTCEIVTVDLKKLIFNHLKEKFDCLKKNSNDENVIRSLCQCRGAILEEYGICGLDWSVKVEFDKSILIQHIATDLCHYSDWRDQETVTSNGKFSKWPSQYMLYLLVICSMLPMGNGMTRFQDTCAEVTRFFEDHESMADGVDYSHRFRNTCLLGVNCFLSGEPAFDKYQACEIFPKVNTQVLPPKVKGNRSKSVLFDACRLASELQSIEHKDRKLEMITRNWPECLLMQPAIAEGIIMLSS